MTSNAQQEAQRAFWDWVDFFNVTVTPPEPVFRDSVYATYTETVATRYMKHMPRFGNSRDFTSLSNGDLRNGYTNGVLFAFLVILIPFMVWFFVLVGLKFTKKGGFCSGKPFTYSVRWRKWYTRRTRNSTRSPYYYEEEYSNNNSNVYEDDDSNNDLDFRQWQKRIVRVRILFVLACAFLPVAAYFMGAHGVSNIIVTKDIFVQSNNDIEGVIDDAIDVTDILFQVIDRVNRIQQNALLQLAKQGQPLCSRRRRHSPPLTQPPPPTLPPEEEEELTLLMTNNDIVVVSRQSGATMNLSGLTANYDDENDDSANHSVGNLLSIQFFGQEINETLLPALIASYTGQDVSEEDVNSFLISYYYFNTDGGEEQEEQELEEIESSNSSTTDSRRKVSLVDFIHYYTGQEVDEGLLGSVIHGMSNNGGSDGGSISGRSGSSNWTIWSDNNNSNNNSNEQEGLVEDLIGTVVGQETTGEGIDFEVLLNSFTGEGAANGTTTLGIGDFISNYTGLGGEGDLSDLFSHYFNDNNNNSSNATAADIINEEDMIGLIIDAYVQQQQQGGENNNNNGLNDLVVYSEMMMNQIEDILLLLGEVTAFVDDAAKQELTSIRAGLEDAQGHTQHFSDVVIHQIEETEWVWIVAPIPIVMIPLLMIFATIVAQATRNPDSNNSNNHNRNNRKNNNNLLVAFLHWFFLPILVLWVLLSFVFCSMTAVLAVTNADFCSGGSSSGGVASSSVIDATTVTPDASVMMAMDHHYGVPSFNSETTATIGSEFVYETVRYYTSQCMERPQVVDPFLFLREYDVQIDASLEMLHQVRNMTTSDNNEEDNSLFALAIALACDTTTDNDDEGEEALIIQSSLSSLLSETELILLLLKESSKRLLLDVLDCQRIVPIYTNTIYDGVCDHFVTGITWIYVCLFVISLTGMIMITLRSSYQNVQISRQ